MISSKESVARLVLICKAKGIKNIVFSPGSRNAPLIISFDNDPYFTTYNIPDERTAGFFALGLSLYSKTATILCCTSGSALLNYSPALSEAYYQKVPLIVLSADRPIEWIDQRAGQTLRQKNVYANFINGSFELLQEADQDDHLWYNDRIVNQAIDTAMVHDIGPVHINIPLHEPLYDQKNEVSKHPKIVKSLKAHNSLRPEDIDALKEDFENHQKIIVLCGQRRADEKWRKSIQLLSTQKNIVVLTEATSNVAGENIICCIDRTIDELIHEDNLDDMTPTLLISCGYSLVSKKIRFLFRAMNIQEHWHVDHNDRYMDTYQSLTLNIPLDLSRFVELMGVESVREEFNDFKSEWLLRFSNRMKAHKAFMKNVPWSDLYVASKLSEKLKSGDELHLANSTSVRYAQLFDAKKNVNYHCNRGVSGIDGCTSTALGFALHSKNRNILLSGDVAFFYDSNAFWHHHKPANFKIVILNNSGGNIFRVIPGPSTTAQLEKHFEAYHVTNAQAFADQHNLTYLRVANGDELEACLEDFLNQENEMAILEAFTPRFENDRVLKEYFRYLAIK